MSYQVSLPETDTAAAWRIEARRLLALDVAAENVVWSRGSPLSQDLFARDAPSERTPVASVPRSFLALANTVVWHRNPERFSMLYALLRRLRDKPHLMSDRGDPQLTRLNRFAKEVRRDKHKMTAFLRFREVERIGDRRRFAAWFEPTHFIAEPVAPFFANRFGDMDWMIFTPNLSIGFSDGVLDFFDGSTKPTIPDDATEDLWRTYFRSIFNPARLKLKAMQSEMPKKYWKNLPEAELIPELIAGAHARTCQMVDAAPSAPPVRAKKITAKVRRPQHRSDES